MEAGGRQPGEEAARFPPTYHPVAWPPTRLTIARRADILYHASMLNQIVSPAAGLTLSQHQFTTFQVCPRRFYLRYLARVPWPEAPLGLEQEAAYERGRRFHRWIERFLLNLPVADETDADPVLRVWWTTFQQQRPPLPDGRRFVESSLTIPIGPAGHRLTGRFDLLVVGDAPDGEAAAHLYDWKTGRPRDEARLRREWQTRVYLAVLAEGGAALAPDAPQAFRPDRLSMTYWYVDEPERPRLIAYDEAAHRFNLSEIEAVVAEIDRQLATNEWPKTDDWGECRHCAYRAICNRQAAGAGQLDMPDPDDAEPDDEAWLEPQWG